MWMIFGIAAAFLAFANIFNPGKNKWLGFTSMAFTALTVMAFYSDAAKRVVNEDWSGLMDILPTTSKMLWVCVIGSIIINAVVLYKEGSK